MAFIVEKAFFLRNLDTQDTLFTVVLCRMRRQRPLLVEIGMILYRCLDGTTQPSMKALAAILLNFG